MTFKNKNILQDISSIFKEDLTRRNWLKLCYFSTFGLFISFINKYLRSFFQVQITKAELPEEFIVNAKSTNRTVELNTYKFDVITVNDKGQEVNRQASQARYFVEDLGNDVSLDLVEIEGGTFMMGFLQEGATKKKKESPRRLVSVPSFYMAKFPITQAQWKEVVKLPAIEKELNPNPSLFKGNKLPVERVSWSDAIEFCQRLSQATGKNYRLPSEAEWEYAARAGTTTPFHFGETITSDLANIVGISQYANEPRGVYRQKTTIVGRFTPNAFGLYDIHGNVWEWCLDSWHESYEGAPNDGRPWINNSNPYRIIRGGSWLFHPTASRSAYRGKSSLDGKKINTGLRCMLGRAW